MNQQIHEEAAEWLVELRSRPDASTRQRFDQWLSTSPEHVRAYLECAAVSEAAQAGPRATPAEIEALIERARQSSDANVIALAPRLGPGRAGSPDREAPAGRSWFARASRGVRFAAAAMVLAAVGASALYWMTRNVYATGVGEQRSILLPDGSTIDLNARSKVRVRFDTSTRKVDLMEGEALFRVAKNRERPFVVSASDTRVRAVGTEFAINRRQRELVVTVVDGTVAVSPPARPAARGSTAGNQRAASGASGSAQPAMPAGDNEILLNAGQQLALSLAAGAGGSAAYEPRQVDVEDAIAWTRRRLVFESTPLADVVGEFNRHSSRELVLQGGGLEDFHVSGAFSSTDVEPFLRFLRAQPGIEVVEEEGRIVIVHR
jgi:transmembrane sensor